MHQYMYIDNSTLIIILSQQYAIYIYLFIGAGD